MAINFSDTLAAIHADLNKPSLTFSLVLCGLLVVWIAWLFFLPLSIARQANGFVEINQSTFMSQSGQEIQFEQPSAISPAGNVQIVALFKPIDAQGYLQVGQQAKIHIDNFPWLQYGALGANIIHIDNLQRDGAIRVVLVLDSLNQLALQQGMEASISVTIATATPWQLLLQSLGRRQINL